MVKSWFQKDQHWTVGPVTDFMAGKQKENSGKERSIVPRIGDTYYAVGVLSHVSAEDIQNRIYPKGAMYILEVTEYYNWIPSAISTQTFYIGFDTDNTFKMYIMGSGQEKDYIIGPREVLYDWFDCMFKQGRYWSLDLGFRYSNEEETVYEIYSI